MRTQVQTSQDVRGSGGREMEGDQAEQENTGRNKPRGEEEEGNTCDSQHAGRLAFLSHLPLPRPDKALR